MFSPRSVRTKLSVRDCRVCIFAGTPLLTRFRTQQIRDKNLNEKERALNVCVTECESTEAFGPFVNARLA
jgi:hypothetical protein